MDLQDDDGSGGNSSDIENLRGKPLSARMFLTVFLFSLKINFFITTGLLFLNWNTVSVGNVSANSSELAKWKRK